MSPQAKTPMPPLSTSPAVTYAPRTPRCRTSEGLRSYWRRRALHRSWGTRFCAVGRRLVIRLAEGKQGLPMRKSERRLTKKLMLNSETVRTLARRELTKVAGGLEDSHDTCVAKALDSHDPCTAKIPLAPSASAAA